MRAKAGVRSAALSLVVTFTFVMAGSAAPYEPGTPSLLYENLAFAGTKPSFEAFEKGLKGYWKLQKEGKLSNPRYFTLIDFSLSSKTKRLWVVDLIGKRIVHHTFVAHGKNTGLEFAKTFSNVPNTNMSSLGFYLTGETYTGKHGLSLYLDGLEKDINDNARRRAIVIHSAEYATENFVNRVGRLGRSFGCPAIPPGLHKEIISLIKGGTALFIYYPDNDYLSRSAYLI